MNDPSPVSDRLFNNADSFAQVFDQAWQTHSAEADEAALSEAARLDQVLARVADHPFALADPETARQVAEFRVRLLGL